RFRERNHFAQRLFSREQRRHAVNSQRVSAMRRRAIRQRVQKKSEPPPRRLVRQPQRLEQPRLHILPVNSYAARPQLHSVQHQIVALRTNFSPPCRILEFLQILLDNSRERMLRAHPLLIRLAPFEERKTRHPQKFPLVFFDQPKLLAQPQSHLPRDHRRRVAVRKLLLRRNRHNQIAALRPNAFRQLNERLRAQRFLQRRTHALRGNFYRVRRLRARALRHFAQIIELFARPRRRALRHQRVHVALNAERRARRLEKLRHILQLHSKTQIRLVRPVPFERVLVQHVPERPAHRRANHR